MLDAVWKEVNKLVLEGYVSLNNMGRSFSEWDLRRPGLLRRIGNLTSRRKRTSQQELPLDTPSGSCGRALGGQPGPSHLATAPPAHHGQRGPLHEKKHGSQACVVVATSFDCVLDTSTSETLGGSVSEIDTSLPAGSPRNPLKDTDEISQSLPEWAETILRAYTPLNTPDLLEHCHQPKEGSDLSESDHPRLFSSPTYNHSSQEEQGPAVAPGYLNQAVQEGAMELKGSPAHTPKKAKTRCEITITLAKEEDSGGSGPGAPGTAAEATAGLAAKAVPCSTTQPRQAKPAGPVHHLSASVESQICCQHGADPPAPTALARPVTGPPVTQRQCWEPIPGSSSEQTAPSRCRSPGPEENRRSAFEDSEVSEEGLLRSEQYEMEAAPERSGAHQTISKGFALRSSSLDPPAKNKRKYIYKVSLVRTDMLSSTSSGDGLPGADNTPRNDSPVNALSRENDVPTDKPRVQEKGEPSDGISKGTSLRQLPRSTSLRDFKKTSYPDLPNIVVHSAIHAQVYSPTKKRWRHVEFGRVSGSDSSEDKSPKEETIHNGGNYTGSPSDRDSPSARECTETDAPNTGLQQNIDSSIIKMLSKEITSQEARGSTRNASPTVNGSPPRNGLQDECCTVTTKYSSEEHGQTKSALSASRLPKQRHSQTESCMTETGGSLQERRWQKGLNNIASVQQSVNSHQRDNIGSLKKSPQHTSWQKQDATSITESPPKDQRNITSPSAGNRSPPEHTWHNKSTSPGAKFPPRASWQNTPLSIMGTSPPRSHRLTKSSITKATSPGGAWHNKPSSIMARSPPSHQFLNKYGSTIATSLGSSWKNKPNSIKTTPSSQVSIPYNKSSRTMTTSPLEIPRRNEPDSRFDFSSPGSPGHNTSNSMMVPLPPGSPLLNNPSPPRVHSPLDSQDGITHTGKYSSTAATSPASSWKNKPSSIKITPSSQVSITHNKSSRTMTTAPLEIPRRNEPDSRFDFSPPGSPGHNTSNSMMVPSPPRSPLLNKPSPPRVHSPLDSQDGITHIGKYSSKTATSPRSSWKNKPSSIKTTPSSQVSIPDNKSSRTMTTAPLEIPRRNEPDSRFDFSPPGSPGHNTSNSMMVPLPPGSPLLNNPSPPRVHSPLDSQDGITHTGKYSSTAATSLASSWKNKPSSIKTTPSSQVSITHNKSSRTMTTVPLEIPRRNEPDSRFDFSPPGSPGHNTSNSMMVPSPPRSPLLNKPSPPRVHSPLDSQDGITHIGKYSSKTATSPGSSWKNKPSSIKTTPSSQVSIPDNKSSRTMTTAPLEISRRNEPDSRFDFSPPGSPGHNTSNSMMVPSPPRSPLLNKPSPPRVHSPLDSQDGITHIGKYSSKTATSPRSSWKNKPSSIKTTPSSQVSIPDNKSSRTMTTAPLEISRRNEPDSRFDFSPPGSPGHNTSNSMMVPSPPRSPLLNKLSPPRVHSPLDSQDGIAHIGKYSSKTATSPGSSWKNEPSSIKTTPSSQVSIPDNKSSSTMTTAPLEIPRHNEPDSRFDFSTPGSPGHNTSNSMMVPSPPRSPLLNKLSPPRVHSPLDSQDGIAHIGKYSSKTATSPGSSWKNKPSSIKTTPSSQVSIPDNKSSSTMTTAPLEIPRHNEPDSRFDFSTPGSPRHNTSNSMMVPSPPGSPLLNKHSPPRAYSPLDSQDDIAHTGIMSMSPPGSPVHNKPTSLYATSPPVIPRKKSLTSKVTELVRESPEQCDSSSLVIASPPESVLKDDFHSMDSQSSPQSPLNKTTRTMKTKSPSESNKQEAVGHIVITSVSSEDQNEMISTMSEQIDKTNEDNETNETVYQLHQKTSNHIETSNRENTSFPKPSKHNEENETVAELEPKSNNQYLTRRKITELPPEINSQDEENSAIAEHLPEISNKNDTSRIVSETTLRNSQNSGSCSGTDSPEENNHQLESTKGVTEPLPKNTIEIVEHNAESSSIARSPSQEEDNEPTLASVKASDWSHATDPEINISAQANLDNNLEFLIPDITRDNEISGTCTTVVNADGPTQHTNSEAADILSGEIFRENDVPTVGVPTLGPNNQVNIISYDQTPMENLETTNMVDPFVGNTKGSKSEDEISSVESGTASSAVNPSHMAEMPSECLEMEDDVTDITSDMESWVDILRRLETPEIMKHARVPRQPRTSPMSVYATLSPIEEDGASPKTPLPILASCSARVDEEIETEDVKLSTDMDTSVKPIQENGDPTDVSEKPKHVFSWEKSISRGMDLEKSSPLEMMRRHVEEGSTQVTRTAGYRSLLQQNSSTRASSSVGSLLLSERLEKTSIPEHKPYSRLNSLLFNSYKGPDKALFGRLEKEGTPNNDTTMPQVTELSDSNGGIHNLLTDPAKQTSDSPEEAPAPSTAPELNVQPNILPPEASSAVATSFSSENQDQLDDLLMNEGCPEETPTPSTAPEPNSQPNILLTEPSSAVAPSVSLENQGQPGDLPMNEAQQSKTWQSEDQQSVAQQETTEAQMSDTQEDELQNNMASEDEDTQSKAQQNKPGHANVQPQAELHASPGGLQEEEHERGKLNPRPGKMVIFTEPGLQGEQHEIWGDLYDATVFELPSSISIRVIRGGWVLYEKPRFQGKKIVLEEGDIELRDPWGEEVDGQEEGDEEAAKTLVQIGSLRHVVRDYAVPAISLFHEENGEGKKMKFMDASYDARMYGQPLKAASIIVHSGLWVVYQEPFFEGPPCILEPGGYPTLKSWGGEEPQICSLQPIQIGCPTVEKPYEPKILLFERAHFEGHSWEINKDICDLKREDDAGNSPLSTVGSLRVLGGCWVGYEKEGFHGHQYLLEEGEYRDWKDWGGQDDHLKSIRLIRADFSEPALVLYAEPDFAEGPCLELSDALPDVKQAEYWTTTQSILVHSGVWVAYENVDYSGAQHVLEKGTYHSCQDWGASTGKISSLLPILQVGDPRFHYESQIHLFSQPSFDGDHYIYEDEKGSLPEGFNPQSCRVHGGSWILYEDLEFSGNQYILSDGEYPTYTAMGCLPDTVLRSLMQVPIHFSQPAISLHGLENFEGKEIELTEEVRSLQAEGFNNHVLSVRVNGGIWVLYEHNDYRGRQWLLDYTEVKNWLEYSGIQRIGSLRPIRQRRIYFHIKNRMLQQFLCIKEEAVDMTAVRVLVSEPSEEAQLVWYYEDGRIKNQASPDVSLQVIGAAHKGCKAVLWSQTRMPCQTWRIDSNGHICSQMFEGMILDVKGGEAYDQDHVILWTATEERPTQMWTIEVL